MTYRLILNIAFSDVIISRISKINTLYMTLVFIRLKIKHYNFCLWILFIDKYLSPDSDVIWK